MEVRKANVIFNKSGGTSINGTTTRITIPKPWIDKMGLSQDNKEVTITFDEQKKEILIKKED